MTKPVVTLRNTKGSALSYSELDTNFQNLRDATITVSDGTNSKAIDLNGTITFTAGSNITIGVNPSTGAITVTGIGSVNPGVAGAIPYYPSAGTTLDDTGLIYTKVSNVQTVSTGTDLLKIESDNGDDTISSSGTSLDIYSAGVDGVKITTASYGKISLQHGSSGAVLLGYSQSAVNYDGVISTISGKKLTLETNLGYTGAASGNIVLNSGANANIEINPNGTGTVVASKAIATTVSAGVGMIDAYSNAASYANNATVDFANFSGMILINRQDTGSGNVALWLCGSGGVVKLGDSIGNQSGTITSQGSVNGYRWTNTTGGTITVSFAAIRTRTGG